MHRSGTSMVTNWLNKCGLKVGDNLLGAKEGNVNGHFEDIDFLNFHENILRYNKLNFKVKAQDKIELPENFKQEAQGLIKKKNKLEEWGWKDPRTCLFLSEWSKITPNAKYLIIFRRPIEIASSIYRRELKFAKKHKNFIKVLKMKLKQKKQFTNNLEVWYRYNLDILNFIKKCSPEKYILLEYSDIVQSDEKVIKSINENWGFDLQNYPINKIFNPKLLKKQVTNSIPLPNKYSDLYEALQLHKTKNLLD